MRLRDAIRAARGERKQIEVAAAVGIGRAYLCDIEKGHRVGSPDILKRLARELGADAAEWLWLALVEQWGPEDAELVRRYVSRL